MPVDAFWSVIVYDTTGHLQKNRYDAYSLGHGRHVRQCLETLERGAITARRLD